MRGPANPTFPAGERWEIDMREVVFPIVLPSGDRLDGRVPAEAVQAVARLPADCLPRDMLDAFRRLKVSVFAPAAERLLADGRIGDAGDGPFVFVTREDVEIGPREEGAL